MTAPVCANGHPATMVDQQFCAVCGAPFPSAPPAAAPAPPAAAPQWGAPAPQPAPQQPAPTPRPAAPRWGAPVPQQAPVPQWGAQPAPVAQHGYSQPAGYGQPPAARGGMGKGALLVGVIAIVALAGGALFMLKGPSGTPSPAARPAATATAAATGMALATPAPSLPLVPVPTALPGDPTVETSAPDPTGSVETAPPVETGAALPSCHSTSGGGFTVSYPAGWNTLADGTEWSCRLFDPNQILVGVGTELPDVAVVVWVEDRPYADVVSGYRTQGTSSTTTDESGTIAGRDATGLELENNGTGYYEKGVLQTVVLIDLGPSGTLVFESTGTPGDRYNARLEGLGTVIGSLVLD